MEEEHKAHIKPMIVSTIVVLIEILLFNIPGPKEWFQEFRTYRFLGIMLYNTIGGILLLIFTVLLSITALRTRSGRNLIHLILTFYLATAMFFWSGIIDTIYYTGTYNEFRETAGTLHDSVWFAILALFIFFFYLYLEFQETDYPPLYRVIIIVFGISPALVAGFFGLIDNRNYVNLGTNFSLAINVEIMFFGLAYASAFGAFSYYKSLRNIEKRSYLQAAQIQFGVMYGLTLSLIFFAINNSFKFIVVHFPILLVTLLIPLIVIYLKNPNYISALATPLYELFVVDPAGITIFVHKFGKENQEFSADSNLSHLKGGLITALSTIFQEVVESKSALSIVHLTDRVLVLEPMIINGRSHIVALIALKSCYYVRNSLKEFAKTTKKYVEKHEVLKEGVPLPNTTHDIITQIFY